MRKVLVFSSTTSGAVTSFVREQVQSLQRTTDLSFEFAGISKKGLTGYIAGYLSFIKKMLSGKYDLVHAHYGLSALLATLQFFKPVVVTFHGCDVNDPKTRKISRLAYLLCSQAIFVEKEMPAKLRAKKKYSVIPCGVDIDIFKPHDKNDARQILGYQPGEKLFLFSSAFDVPVKNYGLAKLACEQIPGARLIELKNYNRQQVSLLLNACDALLLTSIREGSPQVVKEAMACNCPVVSTDVGDVKERLAGVNNCFVCESDAKAVADKLNTILLENKRTNGRNKLINDGLDLDSIAKKIHQVYLNISR